MNGDRKRMYDEAKLSLKKFKGEQLSLEKQRELQLRNMVKNEDVLVLPRTFKNKKYQFHKMRASYNQGGIGVSSGGWKMSPYAFYKRWKNRLNANDKTLRCHFVVLSDIYITSCPDS